MEQRHEPRGKGTLARVKSHSCLLSFERWTCSQEHLTAREMLHFFGSLDSTMVALYMATLMIISGMRDKNRSGLCASSSSGCHRFGQNCIPSYSAELF